MNDQAGAYLNCRQRQTSQNDQAHDHPFKILRRHASAEAGWRLSLGWAEFRDFVRIGR